MIVWVRNMLRQTRYVYCFLDAKPPRPITFVAYIAAAQGKGPFQRFVWLRNRSTGKTPPLANDAAIFFPINFISRLKIVKLIQWKYNLGHSKVPSQTDTGCGRVYEPNWHRLWKGFIACQTW